MATQEQPVALPGRRPLSDGVVLLREPVGTDVGAIQTAASTPDVAHYTTVPSPYSQADAESFVSRVRPWWAAGTDAVWAVCDTRSPELLVGMVGLHDIDRTGDPGGVAELGYWLAPGARGRGLMTRAARLVCTWGVDELGLTRIDWVALVGNEPSRRVAEAVGFQVEGVARRGRARRGERLDHWTGGLLAEDLVRGEP